MAKAENRINDFFEACDALHFPVIDVGLDLKLRVVCPFGNDHILAVCGQREKASCFLRFWACNFFRNRLK